MKDIKVPRKKFVITSVKKKPKEKPKNMKRSIYQRSVRIKLERNYNKNY